MEGSSRGWRKSQPVQGFAERGCHAKCAPNHIPRKQPPRFEAGTTADPELDFNTVSSRQHQRLSYSASPIMATIRAPSASFLSAFLPVVRARLLPQDSAVRRIPLLERIQQLRANASLLPAILTPIPSLLEQIWDGLLKAVPKKKTSHMKKRHRQMAGKALKDVTALNKCSSCGRTKRAHVLCPYCVNSA